MQMPTKNIPNFPFFNFFAKMKRTNRVIGGITVAPFIIDFIVLAVMIIGLTAMLGVISTGIGERIFGRKKTSQYYDQNINSQKGWRKMTRE